MSALGSESQRRPAPPAPPGGLALPLVPSMGPDFSRLVRPHTAPNWGETSTDQRRALYESLEGLKTMRRNFAAPASARFTDAMEHLKSAETSLHRRQWKKGAGQLLVSLAHNGADPRAIHNFDGALDHIRRDRPFFDPGRKRTTWDYGPLLAREKEAAKPAAAVRHIVDDFPQQWKLAHIEEVLKSRTSKLASGVAPEVEVAELMEVFHRDYYVPIRTVFRYYARLDGANVKSIAVRSRKVDNDEMYTISKHEFDAFCTDCRLLSDKALTAPKVNLIFILANKEAGSDRGRDSAMSVATTTNNKHTMVLPEFMNAVVRLAEARYARQGRTLTDRVVTLMERDVLPHARWDDVQEFRRLMKKPEVQGAIAAARPLVRALFDKYCGLDSMAARLYGSQKNKSVSIREFVAMFDELGLLKDRLLSQKDVQDAFATSQADPVIDDDVTTADDHRADSMEELNATEFEEAMVRCAVSRYCAELDARGERSKSRTLNTSRSLAKSFRSFKLEASDDEGAGPPPPRPPAPESEDGDRAPRPSTSAGGRKSARAVQHAAGSDDSSDEEGAVAATSDSPRRIVWSSGLSAQAASRTELESHKGDDPEHDGTMAPLEVGHALERFFALVEKAAPAVKVRVPTSMPAAAGRPATVPSVLSLPLTGTSPRARGH